eukprot:834336_1
MHTNDTLLRNEKRYAPSREFCSVLEFSSTDGHIYVPYWMLQNLRVKDGGRVWLRSILDIPQGKTCKLQPQSEEFFKLLEGIGPRAFLESAMRSYSVLAKGCRFLVRHGDQSYKLTVADCAPESPVSILGNLDLEVEFVPPSGSLPKSRAASVISTDVEGRNGGTDSNENHKSLMPKTSTEEGEMLRRALALSQQSTAEMRNIKKGETEVLTHTQSPTNDELTSNERVTKDSTPNDGYSLLPSSSKKRATATNSDVCDNCGREIPSASIQMHRIHCERNFYKCPLCRSSVLKREREKHFEIEHADQECHACHKMFPKGGSKALEMHKESECSMRELSCKWCAEKVSARCE